MIQFKLDQQGGEETFSRPIRSPTKETINTLRIQVGYDRRSCGRSLGGCVWQP